MNYIEVRGRLLHWHSAVDETQKIMANAIKSDIKLQEPEVNAPA